MLEEVQSYFCLNKKYLVYNLVSRNLKIKYRRSALGYLWSLLVPLAQAGVYYVVFKVFLKVQVPNYIAYVLSGVLFWTFFANTLMFGMESFVSNRSLLTKIPMPLQVFSLVETLSNLVTLLSAVPVLILILFVSKVPLTAATFFYFYYLALLALGVYGMSVVLGLALVLFNDLKHIFSLLLQLWMYATPVLYQESVIPEKWRWILYANPVGLLFSGVHSAVIGGNVPTLAQFFIPLAWAFFSLICAFFLLNRAKKFGIVELL